eukprot:m.280064 g.280064  ORF g.280064 m.280064 type:complete len:265 (+) comp19819_c0_seq3:444-1238(+)
MQQPTHALSVRNSVRQHAFALIFVAALVVYTVEDWGLFVFFPPISSYHNSRFSIGPTAAAEESSHGHHIHRDSQVSIHADSSMSTDQFCDAEAAMSMSMSGFIFTQKPDDPCYIFILQHWVVDTYGKYIGAVLGTFFLAIFTEFFRLMKMNLHRRPPNAFFSAEIVEATLYFCQMILAYLLMLIVMIFDFWLFLAIPLGLGVGRFCVLKLTHKPRAADTLLLEKISTTNADYGALDDGSQRVANASSFGTYASEVSGTPCCSGN